MVIGFQIKDPDYKIMLDPQHPEIIRKGGVSDKADITLKMEADFMHEFGWEDGYNREHENKDFIIEMGLTWRRQN